MSRASKIALLTGASIKTPAAAEAPPRAWIPRCVCKQWDKFNVEFDGERTFFHLNGKSIAVREGHWDVGVENNRPYWKRPVA